MATDETKTLSEIDGSLPSEPKTLRPDPTHDEGSEPLLGSGPDVQDNQENGARVSTVGSDGGFSGDDAKKTGVSSSSGFERQEKAENGGGSPGVKGLDGGCFTQGNRDGSIKEVELDQNGISVVVEVQGSLDNVNEKGRKCGYEDNKVSVAENGVKPGEEVIKVPVEVQGSLDSVNEKGGKCGYDDKVSVAGEEVKKVPVSEESRSDGVKEIVNDGEEDVDVQEHEYLVGDFVWGKIRSHPWWPGRIYDPSDASEYARKYSQGEKLLVAYFGDGSFSWCSPSQLKPFAEDFQEMLQQSTSMSFVNAVQNALDEIGKNVELKMTCSCSCVEDRCPAMNAGVMPGVLVPVCHLNRLFIPLNGPTEILSTLRCVAEVVSITSKLEFTVLRSWLLAFYRAKGGHKLAMYYEPVSIEGLEDKNRNGVTDRTDLSGPVELLGGPVEEDWLSSPVRLGLGQTNQSLLQKCPGIAEDKLYERRKRKTVAELMGEDMDGDPENKEGSVVMDVTTPSKLVSASGKKKGKSSDEALSQVDSDISSPSGRKKGRAKQGKTHGSAESAEKKVWSAKNGVGEETKEDTVSSDVNDDGTAKEETEKASASGRKRRGKTAETLGSAESAKKGAPSAKNVEDQAETKKRRDNISDVGTGDSTAKDETEKASASGRKRGRGKRAEALGSAESAKNGGGEETKKRDIGSSAGSGDSTAKEETEKASTSGRKRRGKRAETLGSAKSAEKGVLSAENGGEVDEATAKRDGVSRRRAKESNSKEEAEKGSASRERKKSKYLSPPFISSKRNLEAESKKIAKVARIGERMSRAAGHLIGSPPILNSGDEKNHEKRPEELDTGANTSAISSPKPPTEDLKDIILINATIIEIVSEVRSAALNPLNLREISSIDMSTKFISAFRSATYLNGSNYKLFRRYRPGRKRKSLSSEPGLVGEDHNQADPEVPESRTLGTRKEEDDQEKSGMEKLKQAVGESRKRKKTMDEKASGEASTPVSLTVTFPPGFSLPSKNDLKAVFSKYGALNETETEVFYDSSCARVVFVKSSDAEEAFNASMEKSPFGPAKVSYRLRYSLEASQNAAASPKEGDEAVVNAAADPKVGGKTAVNPVSKPVDDASHMLFSVKQKLELMTSMLEESGGNMSPKMQSKLGVEMKGLLKEVSMVAASTSSNVE